MLSTDYVPGAPNWLDLASRDIPASAAFYNAVFGWTFQSAGPDAGGYGMFVLDEKTVAGIGPIMADGVQPCWTPYFKTPDAEATAKAVEQAGGTVAFPPMDVFTMGRMAVFTDPAGAGFNVWQPGDNKGLDVVTADNALCWVELHTTDAAAAKAFYHQVFDWEYTDAPMPGMTYTLIRPAGTDAAAEAEHGGLMDLPPGATGPGSAPNWHPYFGTADCDATFATAVAHGATVIMPPDDAPGVGRLAMLLDPAGAQFALLTGVAADAG
ncbi:VOC family protein [Streptomyces sp. H39-S7]|uniref:VOC family protein n=1 Tax=Streptomyces sp. H39-S7 TaxID=3004357 RepID=UPI0022AEAF58|nr:VOC family protein [Streptomyces sp. H39-S7]MCZ4123310.1 VOC family protein [Streptomyces sp. H39-S7]